MYRRAFPKLHHRQAAESTLSFICPLGLLGTRVPKPATQCSLSINRIDQRAIASKSSEKDTAAGFHADDLQHTITTTTRQLDTKDIIIDDLQATLEAHRATNRAAVLRNIATEVPQTTLSDAGIYRPLLNRPLAHDAEPEHETADPRPVKEQGQVKKGGAGLWPADSVQGQRIDQGQHGKGGKFGGEDDGEYTGRNFRPQGYWHFRFLRDMERPWLAHMDGCDGDGLARLEAEIRAYEAYMRLTAAEERAGQLLVKEITSIVGKALPDNPLEIVGSRRTGLATPTSDIDFSLSVPEYEKNDPTVRGPSPLRPKARKAREKKLFELKDALRQSRQFVDLRFVHAKVPIVTGLHRHTGLTVHFQALRSTLVARSFVAAYLSEYPNLRPLYMLLRHVLDIRLLTTVFEGGFGSYTIFMMIVNALKHASIPSFTGYEFTRHDLARQLFWVLDFYATADLYKNGYSADPPRVIPKAAGRLVRQTGNANVTAPKLHEIDTVFRYKPKQPYLLCLQDPADPTNDLGSKSYSIKHVQQTFAEASETIKGGMAYWDNMYAKRKKVWRASLLDALVGAYYGHFDERRRRLAAAAAQADNGGWRLKDPVRVRYSSGIRSCRSGEA